MSGWKHVPGEFREQGIRTPEEAADYISDIIGIVSLDAMLCRIDLAAREGRLQDEEFFDATLQILIDWYSNPPDPDYPPEVRALMDEMEDEPSPDELPYEEPQEPDPRQMTLSELEPGSGSGNNRKSHLTGVK